MLSQALGVSHDTADGSGRLSALSEDLK